MRGRDIDRNSVLKHYEGTGHLARKACARNCSNHPRFIRTM